MCWKSEVKYRKSETRVSKVLVYVADFVYVENHTEYVKC